jgi:hypothetical protein
LLCIDVLSSMVYDWSALQELKTALIPWGVSATTRWGQ